VPTTPDSLGRFQRRKQRVFVFLIFKKVDE